VVEVMQGPVVVVGRQGLPAWLLLVMLLLEGIAVGAAVHIVSLLSVGRYWWPRC